MASGSSGRGSKGFDFCSDDILCSYEDYAGNNQDSSNGTHNDPAKDFHKSRMARTSVFPATAHNLCEDSLSQDVIATVEMSMKKYADNLMRFLEGISSRLSQLELYCYNLDKSIGEMRSDLNSDHGEADSKLISLEKHLQEVHRSLQILRDKQELAETQKELAKLQLVQKESSSSSHSQSNEERSSPSATDPKRTVNASDTNNQQLALALPHQVAPQPQPMAPPSQAPAPIMTQAAQQPPYYMQPTPLPNPQAVAQLPQNQYLPSDPHYRIPQPTSSQVTQSPSVQQFSQYQQLHQPQQQWPQQLPQQVQPPQPPSMQSQTRPPSTNVYSPYLPSQATNPSTTETLPPSMQSQTRPPSTNVYSPYPPSQATNPSLTETLPPSMQSQTRPPSTNVYSPYPPSQATNPSLTETLPPSMQSQARPPSTNVYSPYPPSQATNPSPTETLPNSMPMQMPYSGIPPPGSSRGDAIPYGYGGTGRTIPQQLPPQQIKSSFPAQPGDVYGTSGTHALRPPASAYMVYDGEGGRTHHPPQPHHFAQAGYPPTSTSLQNPAPQNLMIRNPSQSQFIRSHPYNDLIEKLVSMGFRGDHVASVIQRMEESGQPIDFNTLLDRLNVHSSVGPQRGWSG